MSQTMESGTDHWTVLDKNAREKRRIHETPSRKQYALHASEPTPMPKADALVFLRDPAFVVMDPTGRVHVSLPASEAAGDRTAKELEPDQCIARYDELTTEALQARVAARPGGHEIDPTAPRDELVAFLAAAPAKMDERPENRIRGAGEPDTIDRQNSAFSRLPSLEEQLESVPVVSRSAGFGA